MIAASHSSDLYSRLFVDGIGRSDAVAVRAGDLELTYGQLRESIQTLADRLARFGVDRGDRVAVLLGNTPEYVTAFFAIVSLGGIVVATDCRMGEDRLQFIFDEMGPKCVLHLEGVDFPADVSVPRKRLRLSAETSELEFGDEVLAIRAGEDARRPSLSDHPALILFSAGSTGHPKGVVLRHGGLLKTARTVSDVVGMNADHRDLILSPMTHSGGWQRVTGTLMTGGSIAFPQGLFSVPTLLDDIERYGIRGFFTTPPFIRMMLETDAAKFQGRAEGLRSIEIASAPLSADELQRLLDLFPQINVFFQYGSTECSRAFILDARGRPDKLHTVGRATSGVEVRIAGLDGASTASEGEVLLRAPQLTRGYWQRPDLDAERFNGEWFRTGDYGRLDDEGFLTLLGRRDDTINCGGHSYFPAEVELPLSSLPEVRALLVAGVDDAALTNVPWAFVVPEDPASWSTQEFLRAARTQLPAHMLPRRVVVVDELPLTPSGKPSRRRTLELHGPDTSGCTAVSAS